MLHVTQSNTLQNPKAIAPIQVSARAAVLPKEWNQTCHLFSYNHIAQRQYLCYVQLDWSVAIWVFLFLPLHIGKRAAGIFHDIDIFSAIPRHIKHEYHWAKALFK